MQSFNIHYSLQDWSSHLFALGERCAASSNAYQCTVAGNSTVAPSGNGSDIAPGGGAHFKYLSGIDFGGPLTYGYLQQWNDTRPGTQPDNYTVNVWANGSAITTNGAAFVNYYGVTAGSYSTLIRAAPGESVRDAIRLTDAPLAYDATKGVAFNGSGGAGFYKNFFYIDVANVTVQGIQFNDPNNEGIGFVNGGNAAGLTVLDCVLDGYDMVYYNCAGQAVIQCLLINRWTYQSGSGNWPVKWDLAATSGRMVGCTCIGVNASGPMSMATALGGAGQVVIRDSVFFGLPNPAYAQNAAGAITIDHCISDVSTFDYPVGGYGCADAGGNIFNRAIADQFVNTSADFRLEAGSGCINAGVVDTVNIPAGDDITGRLRSAPWDMGAAEYAAAQLGGATISGIGSRSARGDVPGHGTPLDGGTVTWGAHAVTVPRPVAVLLGTDVPGYVPTFNPPTVSIPVSAALTTPSGTVRLRRIATLTRSGAGGVRADPIIKAKQFAELTISGASGIAASAGPPSGAGEFTAEWTAEFHKAAGGTILSFAAATIGGVGGRSSNATVLGNPAFLGSATVGGTGSRIIMNTAPVSYTNWCRNPRLEGGSSGTPGTDPTDVTMWDASTGLTKTINGFGTEGGIPYVEVRLSGTGTAGGYYLMSLDDFVGGGSTGVASGTTWTGRIYLKQQAGSQSGISQFQWGFVSFYTGSWLTTYNGSGLVFNTNALNTQPFTYTATITDTSLDQLSPMLDMETAGGAVDITVRFGGVVFELAAAASGKLILPAVGHIPAQGSGTTYWY